MDRGERQISTIECRGLPSTSGHQDPAHPINAVLKVCVVTQDTVESMVARCPPWTIVLVGQMTSMFVALSTA